MKTEWILVANAAQARLFARDSAQAPLQLIDTLEHPQGRVKASSVERDRPGHDSTDSRPGGVCYPNRMDLRRKHRALFADEISARLRRGVDSRQCASVVLFAASPLLGELKAHLDPAVRRALRAAVPVDLSSFTPHELEGRIRQRLA